MEMRNKRILKTILAMAVYLMFMIAQGSIVVTACIDYYWALWARAGIIWGLVLITICFYRIKAGSITVLGFRRCEPGAAKKALYYAPLLLISLLYFVTGFNLGEGPYYAHATLFLTLAIGMAEEIYFRGIICGMWKENGIAKAMLISAGLFALCHALNFIGSTEPEITVLQISFALIYGMAFALLYLNGKSLVPCVLLHTFHDLCCYMSQGGTIRFNILLAIIQFGILIAYFVFLLHRSEIIKKVCVSGGGMDGSRRIKEEKSMSIKTGVQKCLSLPNDHQSNNDYRKVNLWKITSIILLVCIWILIGYMYLQNDATEAQDNMPVIEQYEVSNVHFVVIGKDLICSFVPNTGNDDVTFVVNLYSYDNSVPNTTAVAVYESGVCEAVLDIASLQDFAEYSVVLSVRDNGKDRNLTLARTFYFQDNGCSWESSWD